MANPILESLLAPYRSAIAGEDPDYENDPLYAALATAAPLGSGGRGATGGAAPGNLDAIQRKLYKGFMDVGRPDLAKMVGTPAFDTWISKESGWDPTVVGPGLGADRRVGGLFQFMDFDQDRPWLDPHFEGGTGSGQFSMPIRRQARMAATQFGLDPEDIRSYAKSIRNNTYKGWG